MVSASPTETSIARVRRLSDSLSTTATLAVAYLGLVVVLAVLTPSFLTVANVSNIARTLAVVGIVAIGETLVILSGGVDISVGSVAALVGVVTSLLYDNGALPIWGCVGVGLLTGVFIGLANGIIVTRLKINPLITTLATFSIVSGIALALTGGQMNQLNNREFQVLGRGELGGIPYSLLLMLALYLLFYLILRSTPYGRDLYAIGGNAVAARLAGIRVRAYTLITYTLCGLLAAVGGMILASQLASASPKALTGLEFTVITAVILGGTSLSGGKGSIVGTLLGVLILRTVDNGLILLGVSSYFQEVARGALLLLVVGLDQLRIRLGRA
jgi:ribose transport system permease protein